MTHTPGPWRVDSSIVRHAINTTRKHVAMVNSHQGSVTAEESVSNAHLISAAPELLEAAELALARLGGRFGSDDMAAARKLKAAIAKARGEGANE